MDSGAEANFISQLWAKQLKLPVAVPLSRTASAINGEPVRVYGLIHLKVRVRDSASKVHEAEHDFMAADMPDHRLVLGYPWLYHHNPKID